MTKETAIMHILEHALNVWEFEVMIAKKNGQIIKEVKDEKIVCVLRGIIAKAQKVMDDNRFE